MTMLEKIDAIKSFIEMPEEKKRYICRRCRCLFNHFFSRFTSCPVCQHGEKLIQVKPVLLQ